MLRVLCAEGVFREEPLGVFGLTEVGEGLRVGHGPREFIRMLNAEPYRAFAELAHALQTGSRPFDLVFGLPRFDWLARHPDAAETFQAAMVAYGRGMNEAVAEGYDFSAFSVVADIGGGHGRLLSAILALNPDLGGILFDLPAGIQQAKKGVGGPLPRTTFVPGDFFQSVPAGADVYVLKKVIHDSDDDRAATILGAVSSRSSPARPRSGGRDVGAAGQRLRPDKLVDLDELVREPRRFDDPRSRANQTRRPGRYRGDLACQPLTPFQSSSVEVGLLR